MQKLFKRSTSVLLGLALIVGSPVVALADENQSVSGSSTSQSVETTVTAVIPSDFTVTIPKHMSLDDFGLATYDITVKGDIAAESKVIVEPVDMYSTEDGDTTSHVNFFMEEQVAESVTVKKDDILVTVTQPQTAFTFDEVAAVDASGANVGTTVSGTIAASDDLSAGSWRGLFQFNVYLDESATSAVSLMSVDYETITCEGESKVITTTTSGAGVDGGLDDAEDEAPVEDDVVTDDTPATDEDVVTDETPTTGEDETPATGEDKTPTTGEDEVVDETPTTDEDEDSEVDGENDVQDETPNLGDVENTAGDDIETPVNDNEVIPESEDDGEDEVINDENVDESNDSEEDDNNEGEDTSTSEE